MRRLLLLLPLSLLLMACARAYNDPGVGDQGKVTNPQDFTVAAGSTLQIDSATLVSNDSVPANVAVFIVRDGELKGTLVQNPGPRSYPTYTYTPPPGFTGIDTFRYTICDSDLGLACSTARVTITVTPRTTTSTSTSTTTSSTSSSTTSTSSTSTTSTTVGASTTTTLGTPQF